MLWVDKVNVDTQRTELMRKICQHCGVQIPLLTPVCMITVRSLHLQYYAAAPASFVGQVGPQQKYWRPFKKAGKLQRFPELHILCYVSGKQ